MKPTTNLNQMKAREMFLEMHRPKIVHEYKLQSTNIQFDDTITNIQIDGQPIGPAIFNLLRKKENVERLIQIKNKTKKELQKSYSMPLHDYRKKWGKHLNYESLIMDKLIDLKKISTELLTVQSGRSFYNLKTAMSIMHQGHRIAKQTPTHEKADWFRQFNDYWYARNSCTKHRLIDILQQHHIGWEQKFAETNKQTINTLEEALETLKELQIERIMFASKSKQAYQKAKKEFPELTHYLTFVSASQEYDEELRLLRSRSVYDFIKGCVQAQKNPYDEFVDILIFRQKQIQKKYGQTPTKDLKKIAYGK